MRARLLSCLCLISAACIADTRDVPPPNTPPNTPTDAATGDAGALDGGSVDAGLSDAGFAEGPAPTPCTRGGCPSGSACLRDVCLDTCGGRALPFTDADLAPYLRPLWTVCPRLGEGRTAALGGNLFHAQASTTGRNTTVSVSTHALRPQTNPSPTPSCNVAVVADRDDAQVYLERQLALSPGGRWAHVAVTLREPAPSWRSLGTRAILLELATCTAQESTYDQFRGAAFLSDDPADLLLMRGTDLTRPAIYRGEVEVARGESWLARHGRERVVAGLYSGHGSVALSIFDIDALRRGPYPVTGGDSTFEQWPERPLVFANGDLLGDATDWAPHRRYAIEGQNLDSVTYTEPTMVASSVFTAVAPAEGTPRIALVYAGGVLVVEE